MSLQSEVVRIINNVFVQAKKISELPDAGALDGSELVECTQSGQSVKTTSGNIAALAGVVSSGYTLWDMSTNLFPSGSAQWQKYYGTKSGSSTLLDKAGNPLPDEVIGIAKIANASTTDPNDWIFENTIF